MESFVDSYGSTLAMRPLTGGDCPHEEQSSYPERCLDPQDDLHCMAVRRHDAKADRTLIQLILL